MDKTTPLSRTEATWERDWLRSQDKIVVAGWVGVYKLTPQQVVEVYKVKLDDLLKAIRRTDA